MALFRCGANANGAIEPISFRYRNNVGDQYAVGANNSIEIPLGGETFHFFFRAIKTLAITAHNNSVTATARGVKADGTTETISLVGNAPAQDVSDYVEIVATCGQASGYSASFDYTT